MIKYYMNAISPPTMNHPDISEYINRKRINEDVRDSERFSEKYHDTRDTFLENENSDAHDTFSNDKELNFILTQHLNNIKINIKDFICKKWCKTIMFSKCERCKGKFFSNLLKQIIDRIKRRSIFEISASYAKALHTADTFIDTNVASQIKNESKECITKYHTEYHNYNTNTNKLLKNAYRRFYIT